ncbi:Ribonuclease G [Candidatus Kinetoplastibacterium sorsogonicusi]|uniref:Ribonuclease G n=1 Tax=Candidatus Kinetoplastidibacterium kentomonadis TaxID=1576550 RepID=A0A3S7J9H9_9PROT|nr:Rne/Rng family ribonuclease [Candidatus Kinetoplastibacterium sorsogonicusi]AWD32321.1 Ribonuclease G [Candidatus Kinetoplastibacterium sorsogonicusi]
MKNNQTILINSNFLETRIAILENNILKEIYIEDIAKKSLVGNIYLGKVIRILPGLQCAFIDIGLEKKAFLHVDHLLENKYKLLNDKKLIENIIYNGQILKVQVLKDELNNKGVLVSTQIKINGKYIIFLPYMNNNKIFLKFSKKIKSKKIKNDLYNKFNKIIKNYLNNYLINGCFLFRSIAENITSEELYRDLKIIFHFFKNLNIYDEHKKPCLIFNQSNTLKDILIDIIEPNIQDIFIDNKKITYEFKNWAYEFMPHIYYKIQYYEKNDLFKIYNIDETMNISLSRKINLKSGGYIIIDQTEALIIIDVNTGSFIGNKDPEDTYLKVNLEAIKEIARLLRLRNLSGIILIDLIDMKKRDNKNVVLKELKDNIINDKAKVNILGFTALGLLEISRERKKNSYLSNLFEPCNICNKTGLIKTVETIFHEICRKIINSSYDINIKKLKILASKPIIDIFIEKNYISFISNHINKKIILEINSIYNKEQYNIINIF